MSKNIDLLNGMNNPEPVLKPMRIAKILEFCDEDLEMLGIDPSKVTDEQFSLLAEGLREIYNETENCQRKFKRYVSEIWGNELIETMKKGGNHGCLA